MVQIYELLKRDSVEEVVRLWNKEKEEQGRDVASASIFQALVDCLIDCSLNPGELFRVPSPCTDELAVEITAQILRRRFNATVNVGMQKNLANFLYELLANGQTVPWTRRVESFLESCSKNAQAIIWASTISAKFFEGLVTLYNCVVRGVPANSLPNQRNRGKQIRFLTERCAAMRRVVVTCMQLLKSSAIIAQLLFPAIESKPFFLQINGIEEIFCGKTAEYDIAALRTLLKFVEGTDEAVRNQARNLCVKPEMLAHIETVMRYKVVQAYRSAYTLAVAIQKQLPQRLFSTECLARIFRLDSRATDVAEVIGQLICVMYYDANDANVFYRQITKFYDQNATNGDEGKKLIEACQKSNPKKNLFTDWKTMLEFIDTNRVMQRNYTYAESMCSLLYESVKILTMRMSDADNTPTSIRKSTKTKVKRLLKLLPDYFERYEPANRKIVGDLLTLYKLIDPDLYLNVSDESNKLQRIISADLKHFTDFDAQVNAIYLANRFSRVPNSPFAECLRSDVQNLYEKMVEARGQFRSDMVDGEYDEITMHFMRFAGIPFSDMVMEPGMLDDVEEMCGHDIRRNRFANKEHTPLFGYSLIMLARCYDSDEQRSAARIKPMNEFVKYLSDVLGRAEAGSDVIFAHFAAFSVLCKLVCTCKVEQPDVVVKRMLQFLFNKLKAIDADPDVLTRDKNNWPNMSAMCDTFLFCGMSFLQDSSLVTNMIEYCILHKKPSYEDIGMRYFRIILKKGATFSNPIVIRMILGKARIALKRVLMKELNEVLAEKTEANKLKTLKPIAGHVLTRHLALDAVEAPSEFKNAYEGILVVKKVLQDIAISQGNSISFPYTDQNGIRNMAIVEANDSDQADPAGAEAEPLPDPVPDAVQRREQRNGIWIHLPSINVVSAD